MDIQNIKNHLQAYVDNHQVVDAAEFLIRNYGLEHSNFAGFAVSEDISDNSILLTAEGNLGEMQRVNIPKNLFHFDFNLVINLLAHEMLHVRQKSAESLVEDKNEREFQAYTEMIYHEVFPQIPNVSEFHQKAFAEKAIIYYNRMEKDRELQQKYLARKLELEDLVATINAK